MDNSRFFALTVVFFVSFGLVGCGMSPSEKQELAASTCNIISSASGEDSTARLKELNSAREKLGEALYSGSDDDVRDSVKFGLCENLVLNDPTYSSLIAQSREMVAAEKKRIEGVAAVACSVMGATRNMDSAVRIKEVNAARVEIGEDPFLSGDDVIKQSIKFGICEVLVAYPDRYPAILGEIKDLERKLAAEKRLAKQKKEEQRVARTRGPLKEWKSAILKRIETVPNPIEDIEFDISYSDTYPLEITYKCAGLKHLDHTFTIAFDNALGTISGRSSIGYCGRATHDQNLRVSETDRDNLYLVIGSEKEGSLLSSVKSIDLEIMGSTPSQVVASRASERVAYKYVDPKNFHPDLTGNDLWDSPVVVRVYER